MLVTGHSRQSLDWIARESAGWINYPRAPKMQRLIVEDWRMEVMKQCGAVYKPFTQSLYIHLSENPSTSPTPIHLGSGSGATTSGLCWSRLRKSGWTTLSSISSTESALRRTSLRSWALTSLRNSE